MAYCYVKSYDQSGEDVFDENTPKISVSEKYSVAKIFKDKATHIKALDVAECTKDEACLANDINMPIKDLVKCKGFGRTAIMVKKDDKEIKECIVDLIYKANESRKNEDLLKLQGAVEYIGKKKGIENPLEYNIDSKSMLENVDAMAINFIQKHFPEKENVQTQTQSNTQSETLSKAIKLREDSSVNLQ
jgi:hypothetical protein